MHTAALHGGNPLLPSIINFIDQKKGEGRLIGKKILTGQTE